MHRKADEEGIPGRITTEENVLARSAASGGKARACLNVAKGERLG